MNKKYILEKIKDRKMFLIFIIGLSIGMAIMTLKTDFDRNIGDSYFYLYVTALNTIVMSILTYYIYKVNVKMVNANNDMVKLNAEILEVNKKTITIDGQVADVNKRVAEITAFQVFTNEQRVQSRIITKTRQYIKAAEIIKYASYPHLSIEKKLRLMKEAIEEDETFNRHSLSFIFPPNQDLLNKDLSNIKLKRTMTVPLNEEEKELVNSIEGLFWNAMPSSIKAYWRLLNYKQSLDYLNKLVEDEDFHVYAVVNTLIQPFLERINDISERNILNQSDSIKFCDLKIENHNADQIHISICQIIEILNSIENESRSLHSNISKQIELDFLNEE